MNRLAKIAVPMIAAALMAGSAHAVTLDFDDTDIGTAGQFNSKGYSFMLDGLLSGVANGTPAGITCAPACPSNGSNYVLALYSPSYLQMSKVGGTSFSLFSFDGAGAQNFNETLQPENFPVLQVTGTLAAGGTVSQTFQIDHAAASGPLAFTTFLFSSQFADLSSVTFSGMGSASTLYNGFSIDNIRTVTPVPEPATCLMLLAGVGLLGLVQRRRAASA